MWSLLQIFARTFKTCLGLFQTYLDSSRFFQAWERLFKRFIQTCLRYNWTFFLFFLLNIWKILDSWPLDKFASLQSWLKISSVSELVLRQFKTGRHKNFCMHDALAVETTNSFNYCQNKWVLRFQSPLDQKILVISPPAMMARHYSIKLEIFSPFYCPQVPFGGKVILITEKCRLFFKKSRFQKSVTKNSKNTNRNVLQFFMPLPIYLCNFFRFFKVGLLAHPSILKTKSLIW